MSNKLKKLTIRGFRGATGESILEFAQNKKITMIFGENGTGKSTIVDAFSFLCEKDAGSVLERSGTRIEHTVSLGKTKEDVCVELETDSGTWSAKLNGGVPQVTPEAGHPTLRVLRRSAVLRLVEAQPAARFDELRNFLALSGIEAAESSLRDAKRTADAKLQVSKNSLIDATKTLKAYWQKEDSPGERAFDWAKKEEATDIAGLNKEKDEIIELKTPLEALKLDYARISTSKETKEAASKADEIARETLQQEAEKISGQSSELLGVLQSAQALVKKAEGMSECPVCEQTVDQTKLSEQIDKRIAVMSALNTASVAAVRTKRALTSAEDAYDTLIKSISEKAATTCPTFKAHTLKCLSDIKVEATALNIPDEEDAATMLRIKPFINLIDKIITTLNDRSDVIQASTVKRNAIITLLDQIDQNKKKQAELERILSGLTAALIVVESKRKDFVSQVLEDISQEVDRLYSRIHPSESIGSLTLLLKEGVKGSLLLHGNFHSKNQIPPQAYFSESHLDTLGLCIFLALAKKYETDIVILDDVITSVDSTHLERIIGLIDEESDHFEHVILTTHYRPWRDQYRYHSSANAKLSFVELRFWSLENGIYIHTNKLAIEDLEFSLTPENFDRQISAQRAGILLESLLNTLSIKYGTKVPNKRPPDYTLGELLSSLSKLSKLIKVERYDEEGNYVEAIEFKEKYEAVFGLVWIRNKVGAHFNFDGLEVSDTQVLQFGKATLDLAKTLICPHSGSVPHKNNGTCWESRKGLTKLHPLTQPQ
jgi:ABC-type cobalamin/Fe3+-siderophores transport system ATPase subunit